MSKPSFSWLDSIEDDSEDEGSESGGLQVVCTRLPLLERHSNAHFVEAVNSAISRVGSKFGLAETRPPRRVATTGSQMNQLAPKRLVRRRSLDLDAAWSSISTRGLGDRLPNLMETRSSGSPASSALTIQELGLPVIFRRNSHSLMNLRKATPSSRELLTQPSQLIAEEKLQQSPTRTSILDFEHLFVQYFVEVKPRSKQRSSGHRLGQPQCQEVVDAWKEVVVDGLLAHKQVIFQHWPELQLSREALQSKLSKELLIQDELSGPRSRVLLTLAPEQVCHRLLWALGDSIPAELGLQDCQRRLQQRFPQSQIRCSDSVFYPSSVIRTLFLLSSALLVLGLRAAACATWLAFQAVPKRKVHLGPTWEEHLDQLSARLILASSLAYFWLLYGIAAAFPLRSLHSPFKRDLGCLAAYSRTGTMLFRLVAPVAACGPPAAMAVRFDRLGLGLLVPAADRPAGLHTAALAGACSLPLLSIAAAWSIRSSFYSHHQLFMVLLFIMHMACSLGFALYFAMMKWAALGAAGVVFAAFYLFVWYQAEFTSVSLLKAAQLQWACAHLVPIIGLLLAASLEVESGVARALVDFICEAQDVIPTKMCIRMLLSS